MLFRSILHFRSESNLSQREEYARKLAEKCAREGYTYVDAIEKMYDANYFGMMMVESGEADSFITGIQSKYSETCKIAKDVIGIRDGFKHFGAINILNTKKGSLYIADTLINRHPSTDTLVDVARLTMDAVRFFADEPVMAMVSYSSFGADTEGSPLKVHEAVSIMQKEYPDLKIDGEMQVNYALNKSLRDKTYTFNKLTGLDVNTLIFPNLSSANTAYKMLSEMDVCESIGPIQMGLKKPIHFTGNDCSVRDIVNVVAVAVIDAAVQNKMTKSK